MEKPFKIIEQDDPNRVEIKYEDKGTIYLVKTDLGFIVDVYNNSEEDCIETLDVWDEDLKEE